jgi:hypothetical protein
MHIKACLARRYIPRAWGLVKMTFLPVHRRANYNEAKGYHPVSLLSFMQKTKQKLVNKNIKGQRGKAPTSIPICLQTRQTKLQLSVPRY